MADPADGGGATAGEALRDTLFGDLPLEAWPPEGNPGDAFPWSAFVAAREHLAKGEIEAAKSLWREVIARPELESRHYLQAWHFLRRNGEQPPEEDARHVLGVVVEVGMQEGLDLLAVYDDWSARYYNFAGGGSLVDGPVGPLASSTSAVLLSAGDAVVHLGPWEGERRGPPAAGDVRLSFLTPSGLYFGEGPFEALSADPLGGPVIAAATAVMQEIVELGTPA